MPWGDAAGPHERDGALATVPTQGAHHTPRLQAFLTVHHPTRSKVALAARSADSTGAAGTKRALETTEPPVAVSRALIEVRTVTDRIGQGAAGPAASAATAAAACLPQPPACRLCRRCVLCWTELAGPNLRVHVTEALQQTQHAPGSGRREAGQWRKQRVGGHQPAGQPACLRPSRAAARTTTTARRRTAPPPGRCTSTSTSSGCGVASAGQATQGRLAG